MQLVIDQFDFPPFMMIVEADLIKDVNVWLPIIPEW